ncbi:PREDICTED: chloride channel protein ClC-Kb-like [Cyprinodon variegatus]|uniref:chloride channel protein ClC-Kb-like n=1 Tax=Cyprinodon variegatus TaxID=28743 RepID=UPI000742B6A4|nr:PREDICTED: chloride channel protein ClC-Kb-like [Cyprinodon variegatus]
MRNFNKSPGTEAYEEDNIQERENNSEPSHNVTPLLLDSWKPCRGLRANVKELLVMLSRCLGSVCGMRWYGFAALGMLTAILSFLMDLSVAKLLRAHQWLYMRLEGHILLQFFCWTLYPACLCAFASSFSHNISPFSTGSGIPEVRAMLAGMEMPHYLSLTNMFAKFLGLICTLAAGSTVFLGKVGPFVHLSTMVGAYLDKLCCLIQGKQKEEAGTEMLVVAAAVGVASCFGAPVSGVLFSVEVMSSHFALRHYFPCFFSAACGALTFHLFFVWSGDGETLQALYKTNFSTSLPFFPLEILLFALLGLLCGALSCCYLISHRWILRFTKTNRFFCQMLTTEKGLYSGLIVFFLASLTFPLSAGQYMASKYTTKQLLTSLLESRQWSSQSHNASVLLASLEWSSSGTPIFLSLAFFLLMKMWMLVLACTLPLPAGYFMPVFVIGAAVGRLLGEGVAYMSSGGETLWISLNPGGYALAGAAAFSGAVTHTLSPALLAVELTGQFSHAVPILLSTVLANALARSGNRPSFYDAISISKKLPYLPSLKKACRHSRGMPQSYGQFLCLGPLTLSHRDYTNGFLSSLLLSDSKLFLGYVLRSELLLFLHHCQTQSVGERLDEVCSIHQNSILVSADTTVEEAYSVLSIAGAHPLFVADGGKLVGQITWSEMQQILEGLAREI